MADQPIPATGKLPFPASGPARDGSGLTARGRRNIAIAGVVLLVVAGSVLGALAATGELGSAPAVVGTWSGTCVPSPGAGTVTLRFDEDGTVAGLSTRRGGGPTRWSLDGDVLVLTDPARPQEPPLRLAVTESDGDTLVLAGDGSSTAQSLRCSFTRAG